MKTAYIVKVPCKSEDYISVSYALVEKIYTPLLRSIRLKWTAT